MYTNEMAFSSWVAEASYKGNALIKALNDAKILYDKWYQLTYGKSDAEVAALPQMEGKTADDISKMSYALGAMNDMYSAMHNIAVSAADRQSYMTPIL